jgi:hypothetical protein
MFGDLYMYTIKVTMQAKTDKQHQDVWRVLRVPETSNLGKLMEAVDISFGWSAVCLSWFIAPGDKPMPDYENDQDFDVLYELPIATNLDKFPLEYEYCIYDELREGWMHTIEIIDTRVDRDDVGEHIVCVDGRGVVPPFMQENNYKYYPPSDEEERDKDDEAYIANVVNLVVINEKLNAPHKPYRMKNYK